MSKIQWLSIFIGIAGISPVVSAKSVEVDLLLKNLYANRNYEASQPEVGSWSQGVIGRAKAQHTITPDVELLFTGSIQYAQRLSGDKHIDDVILPFDKNSKEQAEHYKKIAGSVGIKHENHQLSWGEQWLDTPFATTDYARQLVTSYNGLVYKGNFSNNQIELGRIDKFSPRNEEDFRHITVKGVESDGLNYLNYKYKYQDKYHLNLYYGNLQDLYNQLHVGVDVNHKYNNIMFNSKFRFYSNNEEGDQKLGHVDSQYYGFLQNASIQYHTLGLGYQEIQGNDAFPMIDTVPVLGYINWTQGMFNKAKERSIHVNYQHNFKWIIPNLTLDVKYIKGDHFKVANIQNAKEEQLDFILNYKIKDGRFKGLGLQWFNINYKNNFGGDYAENRIFTTYSYKF